MRAIATAQLRALPWRAVLRSSLDLKLLVFGWLATCYWRPRERLATNQFPECIERLHLKWLDTYFRIIGIATARSNVQCFLKRLTFECRHRLEWLIYGVTVHPLPVVLDARHVVFICTVHAACSHVRPVVNPIQMPHQSRIMLKQLIQPFERSLVFAVSLNIQLVVARLAATHAVMVSIV